MPDRAARLVTSALGPGLLWAMSAVGSGSVLFSPRVGSRYGYEFLWRLWVVAFLM